MTYDDYFTNEDKPFAENLNDALLISNVFDYTVNIELPRMFSNSAFVDTGSPRKAGVSIVTLTDLNGATITTDADDNSVITKSAGTVKFKFYPNFNGFGKIKSIAWTTDNNKINCTIRDKNDSNSILVSNGAVLDYAMLKELQEFNLLFTWTASDTLKTITITMENKQGTRYGADVGITSVVGLQAALDNKVDKVTGKGLSTNDFTNAIKTDIENIGEYTHTTIGLNGHIFDGVFQNKNKIIFSGIHSYSIRVDNRTHTLNSISVPINPFYTFAIGKWTTTDGETTTDHYGLVLVKVYGDSNLHLNFKKLSDIPNSVDELYLHFEYIYNLGGE